MNDNMSLDEYFKQDNDSSKKEKKIRAKKKITNTKEKKPKRSTVKVQNDRTKEKREDLVPSDEEPSNYKNMTIIRFVIWVIFALLIIKGITSLAFPVRPIIKKEAYIQAPSESETAKAFALMFVREYLTYDSYEQANYTERLRKYMQENLSIGNRQGWSQVLEANVYSVRKIDEGSSVVTIYVKIKQGLKDYKEGDDPTITQSVGQAPIQKEIFVKVPITATDQGQFAVSDYPTFETGLRDARAVEAMISLKVASTDIKDEVQETLENFYNIYDDGTEEQISYFMLDSCKIKGYEGMYKYDNIRTIEVYQLDKNNRVLASVQVIIKDEFGTDFEQKFEFIMRKEKANKGLRWYIERFVDPGEKEFNE